MQIQKRYVKHRRKIWGIYMILFFLFAYRSLLQDIPDRISVERGKAVTIGSNLPVTETVESFSTNVCGTYQLECRLFGLIPIKDVTVNIVDPSQVIPCGTPMGIYIETKGVLVVDIGEVEGKDGKMQSPSRHILKKGDYITKVNEKTVEDKEALIRAVNQCGGKKVTLTLRREGETIKCSVAPVSSENGWKIGAWVRDDLAGIGTMTYVGEEGDYGALGHGISDVDTEGMVRMKRGIAYTAEILSIVKGKKGTPGELVGQIQYDASREIGTIDKNTGEGIFGSLKKVPDYLNTIPAVSIGYKQEIETGMAQIIFETDGERNYYDIQIEAVDMNAEDANKSIRFTVTDEKLLKKTGGIVQGMSGAPIIQNGRLVGAVTHVFVNDPARGYGIFMEEMLEAGE